jgi:hypothetical protein
MQWAAKAGRWRALVPTLPPNSSTGQAGTDKKETTANTQGQAVYI